MNNVDKFFGNLCTTLNVEHKVHSLTCIIILDEALSVFTLMSFQLSDTCLQKEWVN